MSELVRVKDPNSGNEFTIGLDHAEATGLTVLDKPAVDVYGAPLPAKNFLDLGSLTVPQLEEVAQERAVDLSGASKKSDIIAAISDAESKE
jgi:hypothetical protein